MHPGEAIRAYVDRPVADIDAANSAARRAAVTWGLPEPELIRAGMNVIHRSGDVMLRVSAPSVSATAALELLEFLGGVGITVPEPVRDSVVTSDGFEVTAWAWIEPTAVPIDWHRVGAMVRTVHGIDPSHLPASVPVPSPRDFAWWDFDSLLEQTDAALDSEARAGIETAIERHRGWSRLADPVLCHGDVHPGNVMMSDRGAVLIDWDLLCWAPRAWDHAPMLTWATRWGGAPGEYEAFASGYGGSMADDPTARELAELRLVAATLMRLAAGLDHPAAMPEAQLRLRYWRDERDAPMWTAQ